VSDQNGAAGAASPDGRKKADARPTLTEYGSVAKLTMTKGTTQSEITPNKKQQCL
jgi:hypothetical protein